MGACNRSVMRGSVVLWTDESCVWDADEASVMHWLNRHNGFAAVLQWDVTIR